DGGDRRSTRWSTPDHWRPARWFTAADWRYPAVHGGAPVTGTAELRLDRWLRR
ncbi:hypothetical protein A2U01_0074626, partial [Trifolium medium]|nr:hypothetical protein [Trifolium medium]